MTENKETSAPVRVVAPNCTLIFSQRDETNLCAQQHLNSWSAKQTSCAYP